MGRGWGVRGRAPSSPSIPRPRLGFKVSLKNVGPAGEGDTQVWSLPLYMLWKLGRYLDEA